MNKQNVMIGMLVLGTFALSCYTIISNDNEMDNLSRQMYKIKQEQSEVGTKINVLFDNYSAINNALSFYESNTDMDIAQMREALTMLDELSSTDDMLLDRLEVIYDRQEVQGQKLLDVREEYSATGGFGVLTGGLFSGKTVEPEPIAVPEEITPEPTPEPIVELVPEPIVEPIVYSCPRPDKSVDFGKYISKISFNRDVSFTVTFDILEQEITNVSFSDKINTRLGRAVVKYLDKALVKDNNVANCSLPFAVKV